MKNTTIITIAIMFFLFGGMVGTLVQTLIGIKKLAQKDNFYQTQIAQKDNTIQTFEKTQNTIASFLQTLMDANKKSEQKDNDIQTLQKELNDMRSSRDSLQEALVTLKVRIDGQKRLKSKSGIPDYSELKKPVNMSGISQKELDNILSGNAPPEKVEAYIRIAALTLPPIYVRELITKYTDIPADDMPADDKLGEYLGDLFRIFKGQSPVSNTNTANIENVLFATDAYANNSPISPTMCFKSNDHKIYACFANQGVLKGISKLVHRWTNKSTGEIIQLETRPIDPNALFNYIWVRKTDGWQVGDYEVVLFNTLTLEKVAEGNFTVVAEENKK